MYRGKHEQPRKGLGKYKKSHILLVSLLLVMTIGVGATAAFLMDSTGALVNIFNPSKVSCEVTETFDGKVKSDVSIKNTSNIPAYIRAEVIVTWQDADGNILGKMPVAGADYSITYPAESEWIPSEDGYYYYPASVAVGDSTPALIAVCKPLKDAPAAGYFLCVEIIAEAIQAQPETAVIDAWGFVPGGSA